MIEIDEDLRTRYGIDVATEAIEGIKVKKSSKEFEKFKDEKIKEALKKYDLKTLKDDDIVRKYRAFFWKIGIDPTKIRPSSEALVRRVLSGNIPRINMAVDCYNLASIETLIAMGAYNLGKVKGELSIKFSTGERFIGIGKKEIITKGQIVLRDEEKILSIYPYRDADITKITDETSKLIIVSCGVEGIEKAKLNEASELAKEYIAKFCL